MEKNLIERTWDEIGCKIKATGYKTWVRTKPHQRKTEGGIWLPPKLQSFHGDSAAHLIIVHATVLTSGPVGVAAEFKPGDTVAFQRLHFGYMWKLDPAPENSDVWGWDEEFVGWLDANQILWHVVEDGEDHDVRGSADHDVREDDDAGIEQPAAAAV